MSHGVAPADDVAAMRVFWSLNRGEKPVMCNAEQLTTGVVRFSTYCRWQIARVRAGVAPVSLDVAKRFVSGPGLERPRIWGAFDLAADEPTDRTEGNLDPFWGLVMYHVLGDYDVHIMEKIVTSALPTFHSNDPRELGDALWLASMHPTRLAALRERALASLVSLWEQGYFAADRSFRRGADELWACFGMAVSRGAPTWYPQLMAQWNPDTAIITDEMRLAHALASHPGSAWDPAKALRALSVRELRQALAVKGIDARGAVEKDELVKLLMQSK